MYDRNSWNRIRNNGADQLSLVAMGAVRFTLLFGSAAVALALIAVPLESNHSRVQISGTGLSKVLDRIQTGSIPL